MKQSPYRSGIRETEFLSRIDKIKKYITLQNLGALVVFSTSRAHIWYQTGHVSYLSGWADRDRICESMVVVPETGEPVLIISGLPYMAKRARESSFISDIRIVTAADPRAAAAPGINRGFGIEVSSIIKERGLEGKKIGLAGFENMPVPIYQSLVNAFSESNIELTSDIVADMRSRKSPAEMALMRKAVELSDLGYQTLLQKTKPGMLGYEAVAAMEQAVRAEGADYVQYWMCSGPSKNWPVTIPDIRPHERKLCEGDQITCCSYVVYKGYWAHSMRTGALSISSPQQKEIFTPCLEIHKETIDMIKPGVLISDVVNAARCKTERAGMKIHCSRIGHGIGLDYGERPLFQEDNNQFFESGHVVEVHIQFDLPGTENFYVPLGDMCYVTESGVEVLSRFPQEAFLI